MLVGGAWHLVQWMRLEVCTHRRRAWLMGRICPQDARREHQDVAGCIEEALKQSYVADIMVTVDPKCQLREVCHGLTDAT